MISLDDALLAELGLAGLPPDHRRALLFTMYEELELRVGLRLAKAMSDSQLSAFEVFIKHNDEPAALVWLETNFPNYRDVVADEFAMLRREVVAHALDVYALSSAYGDVSIELEARKSPWAKRPDVVEKIAAGPAPHDAGD